MKSKSKSKDPPKHLKNLCQFVVETCNLHELLQKKIKDIVSGEIGLLYMLNRSSWTRFQFIKVAESQGIAEFQGTVESQGTAESQGAAESQGIPKSQRVPESQGTAGSHWIVHIKEGDEFHGKLEHFYLLVENAAFMKCVVNTNKKSFSFFITLFNKETNPIFVFRPLVNKKDKNIPTFNFSTSSGHNEELKLVLTAQIYKEPIQE